MRRNVSSECDRIGVHNERTMCASWMCAFHNWTFLSSEIHNVGGVSDCGWREDGGEGRGKM